MRPLLIYACPHEVRWVTYEPKKCIGVRANRLEYVDLSYYERVILFGSAGYSGISGTPLDKLYSWDYSEDIVDMESAILWEYCTDMWVDFISIRYIIDYNWRRVKPRGVNHFWRKFQHHRMQRKFDGLLKTDLDRIFDIFQYPNAY